MTMNYTARGERRSQIAGAASIRALGTLLATVSLACALASPASAETGIKGNVIRIGGVMDLKGDSRGLGLGMKAGIEAAFRGVSVNGHTVEFVTLNDNYSPNQTIESTVALVDEGIFAMVGNVGTPTAKVALPILAKSGVPAVGFFTGAGLLRPGVGDVVNFRASYVQETAAVINSALGAGIAPNQVCAFVQNDAYGMAGVAGIKLALEGREGTEEIVPLLDEMMVMQGDNPPRNLVGPVGVYERNTLFVRDGYDSIKAWESSHGVDCRLIVSVGAYPAVARFTAYARNKGETWVVSAVSFTGADNFRNALQEFAVRDRVIMTQVVPPLDSDLPIVHDARKALGADFGYVTLEGYIVGRLFIAGLQRINGPITRKSFLDALRGQAFNLGGLAMDFTNDNQGSDLVALTYLTDTGYRALSTSDW